jgi:hypothetical protein
MVPIQLDKTRRLRFGINSICDLEELLEMPIMEIVPVLQDTSKMKIQFIRGMLWAGLRHEDEDLTPRKCGAIIDDYLEGGGTLEDLFGKVSKAFTSSGLFKSEEDSKDEKKTEVVQN